jgi:4,5-dihydroxyphthalate decarboxylase
MTVTVSVLDTPLTRGLLDDVDSPDRPSVSACPATSVDRNTRAMLAGQYDVAEMSLATYLRARLVDGAPLLALPAFTGRRFLQPLVYVAPDSPVRCVEDLPGRRVAVPQYWMTSSLWHRAVLESYYQIPAATLSWVTTADERIGCPPPVPVQRWADGRRPAELVATGDADAVLGPRPSGGELRPLFPDPVEQQLYYNATSVFPIMHLVVVREQLLSDQPDTVRWIWHALSSAQQRLRPGPPVPDLPAEMAAAIFDGDPWSFDLARNAASLDTVLAAAHREGWLPVQPDIAEVFVAEQSLS